jgi:uracil-DNA glycosylase
MILPRDRLGAWGDLPFFTDDLPGIEARLRKETGRVCPPPERMFAALELCQPDTTCAVILGQDPYHTPGKADGLAFSIPDAFGGRLDSLGNILKELAQDLGQTRTRTNLQDWATEGVLLLNTALSVPAGKAGGHARIGWRALVDQVLDHLAHRPVAYLLWGAPAQKIGQRIDAGLNLKIETPHPSPLSAYRGFFGSRPFSKVNAWLIERGERPINWVGS